MRTFHFFLCWILTNLLQNNSLVFDFAAKTKGISVNSMLVTGPDSLAPLVQEFYSKWEKRKLQLVLTSKKCSCKSEVTKEDQQQCQRFLVSEWRQQSTTRSMGFGPTCSPSAAKKSVCLFLITKCIESVCGKVKSHHVLMMAPC